MFHPSHLGHRFATVCSSWCKLVLFTRYVLPFHITIVERKGFLQNILLQSLQLVLMEAGRFSMSTWKLESNYDRVIVIKSWQTTDGWYRLVVVLAMTIWILLQDLGAPIL